MSDVPGRYARLQARACERACPAIPCSNYSGQCGLVTWRPGELAMSTGWNSQTTLPHFPIGATVPLMAEPFKITVKQLQETLSNFHFANEGDGPERQYWPILKERFPTCECFWREFVVPLTKRIELPRGPHKWRRDELRMVHYPFSLFEGIAGRVGVTVEYIGEWGHPRRQTMMAFRSRTSQVGARAGSAAT